MILFKKTVIPSAACGLRISILLSDQLILDITAVYPVDIFMADPAWRDGLSNVETMLERYLSISAACCVSFNLLKNAFILLFLCKTLQCPQCNRKFKRKEIINLYAPLIVVPNDDLEKVINSSIIHHLCIYDC